MIEVGCYLGGLTGQIAYLASTLGIKFSMIDINPRSIAGARETVWLTAPDADVIYHLGTLDSFVDTLPNEINPLMMLIDADHTYQGVTLDIASLYHMAQLPHAAIFHDFGLRGTDTVEGGYIAGVDSALFDSLGQNSP